MTVTRLIDGLIERIRSWDLPIVRRVFELLDEPEKPISEEERKELREVIKKARIASPLATRQLAYIKDRARKGDKDYKRLQTEIVRMINEDHAKTKSD